MMVCHIHRSYQLQDPNQTGQHKDIVMKTGFNLHFNSSCPVPRFNFRKANWKGFSNYLEERQLRPKKHLMLNSLHKVDAFSQLEETLSRDSLKNYISGQINETILLNNECASKGKLWKRNRASCVYGSDQTTQMDYVKYYILWTTLVLKIFFTECGQNVFIKFQNLRYLTIQTRMTSQTVLKIFPIFF